MRTAKVIITFTDAQEGILRNLGDVFQAADKRAEELEAKGFVELEPKKTTAKKKES